MEQLLRARTAVADPQARIRFRTRKQHFPSTWKAVPPLVLEAAKLSMQVGHSPFPPSLTFSNAH